MVPAAPWVVVCATLRARRRHVAGAAGVVEVVVLEVDVADGSVVVGAAVVVGAVDPGGCGRVDPLVPALLVGVLEQAARAAPATRRPIRAEANRLCCISQVWRPGWLDWRHRPGG